MRQAHSSQGLTKLLFIMMAIGFFQIGCYTIHYYRVPDELAVSNAKIFFSLESLERRLYCMTSPDCEMLPKYKTWYDSTVKASKKPFPDSLYRYFSLDVYYDPVLPLDSNYFVKGDSASVRLEGDTNEELVSRWFQRTANPKDRRVLSLELIPIPRDFLNDFDVHMVLLIFSGEDSTLVERIPLSVHLTHRKGLRIPWFPGDPWRSSFRVSAAEKKKP